MVFPLFWMVSTALKTEAETMGAKLVFWPAKMQFQNFNYVIDSVPFFRYMINTAVVTAMQMASELILGIMAAYAFSKGRFHGKHFLFIVVLGAMMIPLQVTFIPLYLSLIHIFCSVLASFGVYTEFGIEPFTPLTEVPVSFAMSFMLLRRRSSSMIFSVVRWVKRI